MGGKVVLRSHRLLIKETLGMSQDVCGCVHVCLRETGRQAEMNSREMTEKKTNSSPAEEPFCPSAAYLSLNSVSATMVTFFTAVSKHMMRSN